MYRNAWTVFRTTVTLVLVCVIALEVVCQAYFVILSRRISAIRQSPIHYFEASDDPILVYRLARGKAISLANRRLKINRYCIREDSDDLFPRHRRLAVLGDSVTFGIDLSQEDTITA